jgi:hypothetical protein
VFGDKKILRILRNKREGTKEQRNKREGEEATIRNCMGAHTCISPLLNCNRLLRIMS